MSEDTPSAVVNLAKSPKPTIKKATAKDYIISVGSITGLAVFALLIYNGLRTTFIGDRLSKVNTEIWITLGAGALGGFWKWQTEKEKIKLETAQANAITNAQAIKALEYRIDVALTQVQNLRSIQLDDTSNIDELKKSINDLHTEIADHRHKLLLERIELIQEFYREICQIHSHISYSKGMSEGMQRVMSDTVQQLNQDDSKT